MKIVFRVDSSQLIGSGHVMRCLTLAKALRSEGVDISFVCRDFPGNLSELIEANHFLVKHLVFDQTHYALSRDDDEYALFLAVPWLQDAEETLSFVNGCDLLIVDHYGLDHRWQTHLRQACKTILVIDDLANRMHDCDFLLDHNFYPNAVKRYSGLLPDRCTQLCGPQYALMSDAVLAAREWRQLHYQLPTACSYQCVVFMGGSDAGGYSEPIVDAVLAQKFDVSIQLVMGLGNPLCAAMQELYYDEPMVTVLLQPDDFTQRLAECDFVIGAGGVSVLERLCIGVPSLVLQIAENQTDVCEALGPDNGAIFMGKGEQALFVEKFSQHLPVLFSNLEEYARKMNKLMDGKGARRIAKMIEVAYEASPCNS